MKMIVCLSARGEELCRHFARGEYDFESLHAPRNVWHVKPRFYVVHELMEYPHADA